MRRTVVNMGLAAALVAALAGCGGNNDATAASGGETSTSPAATTSASAPTSESASPTAASLPEGCEPPSKHVKYKDGSATLEVTSGPDTGHYELSLDHSQYNAYFDNDKEITGNWISDDKQAVLFIDIEGDNPCKPDAFTSTATQGRNGPTFVDGFHTACDVQVTSLGAEGVQGTFDCKGLLPLSGGGKNPPERDANGTFTLLP